MMGYWINSALVDKFEQAIAKQNGNVPDSGPGLQWWQCLSLAVLHDTKPCVCYKHTAFVIKTELLSLEQNSQFRTSLVVQWLRVCTLPIQEAWVWFLVKEPRSHTPQGTAKDIKKDRTEFEFSHHLYDLAQASISSPVIWGYYLLIRVDIWVHKAFSTVPGTQKVFNKWELLLI